MAMQPSIVVERTSHSLVQAVAIAPERREFFTTSDERFVKVWSLDTGHLVRAFEAHRGKITALVWVGSLRFVASTSLDHSLAVWSIKGECVARAKFPCAIYSAEFSTRHNAFIVGGVKKMFILKLVQNRDDWDFLVDKEFSEHSDFISRIVCTPAGRIFSCGYDGVICAFEQNVSEQIVVMTVGHGDHEVRAKDTCHKGAITCATLNTESGTLITGGYDMLVKIWNSDSLTAHAQYIPLATLNLNRTILSLAYVHVTRMVLVGTAGSHAPYLMDPRTGSNMTQFQPHQHVKQPLPGEHPTCLVATNGNEAISVSDQKRITIWRYNPLACVAIINAHTDWVEFLVAHPFSSSWGFVSGGADSSVRCWYAPSALYPQLYSLRDTFTGHAGSVVAGVMTPDGSAVFTAGDDMLIRAWALEDAAIAQPEDSQHVPTAGDDGSGIDEHGVGGGQRQAKSGAEEQDQVETRACSATANSTAEHKDVVPGEEDRAGTIPAHDAVFLTQAQGDEAGPGQVVANASPGGVDGGAAVHANGPVDSAPDTPGASLGVGSDALYVRQGAGADLARRAAPASRPNAVLEAPVTGSEAKVAGGGGEVESGQAVMTLQGHEGRITALCLLFHYLISVSADHSVRIWDSNTGTLWRTIFDAHELEINDVSACEVTESFCTVSADTLGYIWDLETAELCGVCRGHAARVSHVEWVARERAWVTACDDGTLRMWEPDGRPRPGALARDLSTSLASDTQALPVSVSDSEGDTDDYPVMMKMDTEGFTALAVNASDGNLIVGLSDSSVAIVDLAREQIVKVYKGHEDVVRGIICLPAKGLMVTAGWDHTIRVWLLQASKSKARTRRGTQADEDEGYGVKAGVKDQGLAESVSRPYAETNPPYEPVSLKNLNKGIPVLNKTRDDKEPPPEMTPFEKKERAKQQSHMTWILNMIEQGKDEALKPIAVHSSKAMNASGKRSATKGK